MRVAALQYDVAWEDKPANHRIVESLLEDLDLPKGSLVVLPELGDTGFSFNLDLIVDGRTLPWAKDLARRRGIWLQVGHAERGDDGLGRNCTSLVGPDGTLAGTYAKVHPFSFGKESEHFARGDHLLLRRCGGAWVCPLICYDLRFPELWRLAVAGTAGEGGGDAGSAGDVGMAAEVFTMVASWPDARQTHWRSLLIARAIENQAFVVGVNRVGADPYLGYAGGSIIVSPRGDVLAEASDTPAVLQAELDLDVLRQWRRVFPALADMHGDLLGSIRIDRA